MDILVISDTHISPARSFVNGWEKLAAYCVKNKPRYIIHLGDVADLDSLNWYKDRRGNWTTEEELAHVQCHLQAFEDVIDDYNAYQKQVHKKMYHPKKILCLGNHDVRKDFNGIEELFKQYGWVVSPYLEPVKIDNILFSHYMTSNNSDTILTTAKEALETWHISCVTGHQHIQEYASSYSYATEEMLHSLKCPCFNMNLPEYATQSGNRWAKGWTEISLTPFQFVWRDLECLWKNY